MEIVIGSNRSDIFFKSKKEFNILNILDRSCKELVIEIQHSPINEETLRERESNYRKGNMNLLWIFDLKDSYSIDEVILFTGTTLKMTLIGRHHFTNLFIGEQRVNILLDAEGEYLYNVVSHPKLDYGCVEVERVKRTDFLKSISKVIGSSIVWDAPLKEEKNINVFDYEKVADGNDRLRYMFYVLEKKCFSNEYMYSLMMNMFNIEGVREIIVGRTKSKYMDINKNANCFDIFMTTLSEMDIEYKTIPGSKIK